MKIKQLMAKRATQWGLLLTLGSVVLTTTATRFSSSSRLMQDLLQSLNDEMTEEQKRLPENAVRGLDVAEGLAVQLFASEPTITNPTNIDIDHRGRVWVLEAFNYRPAITGNTTHEQGDRILILEDTNADGQADATKVFYQGPEINAPLGIWVMGNRVVVSQSPYVWLFTDENGDDKADKKEVIFQGIKGEQHDHGMHAMVFGPDGKMYFNFGNEGGQLLDRNGQPVRDQDGRTIDRQHYKQGLVFRCDPDFSNVEVLGQNFRNNFEVAVDSYGTMWQSDNDDDGNKGVRINYVMEYGNYGYTDEITGAGWQASRTNMEEEIPKRHWHLNDPGVIPNLLQTGAGSPTGICLYEGTMLPKVFQNQVIHCDAGPNVVRAYPVKKDGAGYEARIENVLYGARDQWFRPSDVCVAPDGSLMVSDWYDPGVGGHQAGDLNRGRIFRVAPPTAATYQTPRYDYTTAEGAVAALQNPNLSVRYMAWNALHGMGERAEGALLKLWKTGTPRMKARAFWLLAKLPNKGQQYVDAALASGNADLKMAAIRCARQLKLNLVPIVQSLVTDSDAGVRRECALALHHSKAAEAPELWAQLAQRHDGQDRWYLEALGIGAADQWDAYFGAWLKLNKGEETASLANRDIVWRARTDQAIPFLASLATEPSVDLKQRLRYFRAFDFNKGPSKSPTLLAMLSGNAANQNEINRLALSHLDADYVKRSPEAKKPLLDLLKTLSGKPYLELAAKYGLEEENPRLLQMALDESGKGTGRDAAGQLLKQNGSALIWKTLNDKDLAAAGNLLQAMRGIGSKESLEVLEKVAMDKKRTPKLRADAIRNLGGSWGGEDRILELLKTNKIEKPYVASAVQGVSSAWRKSVRTEAAAYLGSATVAEGKKLPPISELIALKGDPRNGIAVYQRACATCHMINEEGMDFGPKLSEIGSKLPKEGQYLAILHPDAGVSFGYEGWEVKFKDGTSMMGIVASKTETDLQLKMPGGTVMNYKMADVKSLKQTEGSMMPAGLAETMSQQELVDLVEYLMTLKKK